MPNYGLDAELKAKQDAKFDKGLETEVIEWMEQIVGEKRDPLTTAEWLNDGKVLCKLINGIKPGTIKKVNTMKAPFKKMENITAFTDSARSFGVMESSMFATPDLYEEKNMGSVINCIYMLGGVIQSTVPDFTGPKLGVMINAHVPDAARGKKMATQTGGFAGTLDQASVTTHARDVTFGAGGNASHNRQGVTRSNAKDEARDVTFGAGGNASHHRQGVTRSNAKDEAPQGGERPPLPDGEFLYGLDKELKEKRDAKYDSSLDQDVSHWIEGVTGDMKGDQTTAEWLKNGQVLCKLADKIKPGSSKGVTTSGMPFKQMENIKLFLGFARDLGMAESSLFSTLDLFEEKNMPVVLMSLNNLGGTIQTKVPEFKGPFLGTAIKAEIKDASRGLAMVTDQNEAMQRHMQVERPKDVGVAFGAKRGDTHRQEK